MTSYGAGFNGTGREADAVTRLVTRVDLGTSSSGGVDARFAHAIQIGDHNQQDVHVGVGPLVPPPDSTAAAIVKDATDGFRPPPVLEGLVARARRKRWVLVSGSAGSGKSAVLCALARPDLCAGRVPDGPDHFVHAVISLDAASTAWWLATALAEQFVISIPRYKAAVAACRDADPQAWDGLSLWEQKVTAPLALLHRADLTSAQEDDPARAPQVFRVVVDGWDQVRAEDAADLRERVYRLAHDDAAPVHVIVAARTEAVDADETLSSATRLELPPALEADVADYLQGRQLSSNDALEIAHLCAQGASAWLLARLIGDAFALLSPDERVKLPGRLRLDPDRRGLVRWLYQTLIDTAIAVLASTFDDTAAAPPARGSFDFNALRPVLAPLAVAGSGPVMPRTMLDAVAIREGADGPDMVSLALTALDRLVIRVHEDSDRELVGLFHPTVVEYLSQRGPHWVDIDNTRRVMLDELERLAPIDGMFHDNPLARWAEQAEVDFLWTAGMPRAAIRAMERRPLPMPRANLERWRAALPRLLSMLIEEQLATNRSAPSETVKWKCYRDPSVLRTRYNISLWTGMTDDAAEALRLSEELLPDVQAVLGPRHSGTLATRNNIASFTGQIGNIAKALRLLNELLVDQQAVLGPQNPGVLTTRHNIAALTGQTGNITEALRLSKKLLPELVAVKGPDDLGTLTLRSHIAGWTAETGNIAEALHLLDELLADQQAVLGPHSLDTLRTRSHIAGWTAETGNIAEAVHLFNELLADQQAVLGPQHPAALSTQRNIAAFDTENLGR